MSEEELLKKYRCNNLSIFIDQYLTCQVAYDLLKTQFKEIERLNNIIEIKNNRIQQLMKRTRSAKIDKAIEFISYYCITSEAWEDLGFCQFVPIGEIKYKALSSKKVQELLDILKSDSNE